MLRPAAARMAPGGRRRARLSDQRNSAPSRMLIRSRLGRSAGEPSAAAVSNARRAFRTFVRLQDHSMRYPIGIPRLDTKAGYQGGIPLGPAALNIGEQTIGIGGLAVQFERARFEQRNLACPRQAAPARFARWTGPRPTPPDSLCSRPGTSSSRRSRSIRADSGTPAQCSQENRTSPS